MLLNDFSFFGNHMSDLADHGLNLRNICKKSKRRKTTLPLDLRPEAYPWHRLLGFFMFMGQRGVFKAGEQGLHVGDPGPICKCGPQIRQAKVASAAPSCWEFGALPASFLASSFLSPYPLVSSSSRFLH